MAPQNFHTEVGDMRSIEMDHFMKFTVAWNSKKTEFEVQARLVEMNNVDQLWT